MADMPSSVTPHVSWFDRLAQSCAAFMGRAAYFLGCLVVLALWALSYPLWASLDTWQLVVNTVTTVVTFLGVALLQNALNRSDKAVQHKLNAVAEAQADLMEHVCSTAPGVTAVRLRQSITELRAAVGLEHRESA